MPVIEVADHETMPLKADHVYVIAPDRKLEITDSSVSASPFDQPRGQRTAIDLFFRSLAAAHGDSFAVLLSGSGSDGAVGVKAVKERGGLVFVQDPSEAVHGGMPRAAIATGVADLVLPVGEIAARLAEMARNKQRMMPEASHFDAPDVIPADEEKALKGILDVLRKRTGHDFSKYKRSTVLRRLSRRMQLAHQLTIDEYLRHLRTSAGEVQALFDDLLISVTTFFRDPEAWAAVQTQVIGPLVERSGADEQLRVWVPGCATGEEAYTVAILLAEEFDRRRSFGQLHRVRLRPGRRRPRRGTRGAVPARHRRRRQRRPARAIFPRRRRSLSSRHQSPRPSGLRRAQPSEGSAVFQAPSHFVPQFAHLSRSGSAAADHEHLPICLP